MPSKHGALYPRTVGMPLGKPRHLGMARLFSCVFRLSMQTEGFRFRREQAVLFGQQIASGTDLCQRRRQRAVSEDGSTA